MKLIDQAVSATAIEPVSTGCHAEASVADFARSGTHARCTSFRDDDDPCEQIAMRSSSPTALAVYKPGLGAGGRLRYRRRRWGTPLPPGPLASRKRWTNRRTDAVDARGDGVPARVGSASTRMHSAGRLGSCGVLARGGV